jgi:hypothetical protein
MSSIMAALRWFAYCCPFVDNRLVARIGHNPSPAVGAPYRGTQGGCLNASSPFHYTCPIPLGGGPARSPPMVYQPDTGLACRGRIHRPQGATALTRCRYALPRIKDRRRGGDARSSWPLPGLPSQWWKAALCRNELGAQTYPRQLFTVKGGSANSHNPACIVPLVRVLRRCIPTGRASLPSFRPKLYALNAPACKAPPTY